MTKRDKIIALLKAGTHVREIERVVPASRWYVWWLKHELANPEKAQEQTRAYRAKQSETWRERYKKDRAFRAHETRRMRRNKLRRLTKQVEQAEGASQ